MYAASWHLLGGIGRLYVFGSTQELLAKQHALPIVQGQRHHGAFEA
jgi:hypothetical protein